MNSCTLCGLPVLELDGQFENLEPYYAEAGHPAAELVGECHSSCLARSEHGPAWHGWRVRGYSTHRGYRIAAEQEGWSVLVHTRHPELLAFHVDGSSIGASRLERRSTGKAVKGGLLVPVEEEFNLVHSDLAVVDELKARLTREGNYPVLELLEALAIHDRVRWPQALEGAQFLFDRSLQRDWTRTGLGMRARYAKLLPDPVVPLWRQL